MEQNDHANPDLGKTAEELALEREIAELHAQGREEERGAAADRLAALRMARTFGTSDRLVSLAQVFEVLDALPDRFEAFKNLDVAACACDALAALPSHAGKAGVPPLRVYSCEHQRRYPHPCAICHRTARAEYVKCVQDTQADHAGKTWCGRFAEGWCFESIDHAAQNGRGEGKLVVCLDCLTAITAAVRAGHEP